MVVTVVRSLAICVLAGGVVGAAPLVNIDAMKHNTQQITQSNFDGVISKFRDSTVASLWFYKEDNKADQSFFAEYEKFATDLKGMVKTAALSCTDWPAFCEKQGVKETPTVMLYPTNPMSAFKYDGKFEAKPLLAKAARLIPDFSTRLAKDSIDNWLTTDSSKPKVILFSNKKNPPMLWKALSSEIVFRRTLRFGFITEDEKDLCSRFKVSKFPTVLRQLPGKKQPEKFDGELNFQTLQEWVGVHSESGMGDTVNTPGSASQDIEEAKPWLVQEVPELTAKSHNDVCFKGEGLCVIYLIDGEVSTGETEMLTNLKNKFTSQLSDRGAKMKWMYMNLAIETEYKKLFEPAMLPSAVVFNPHKRLRFTKLDHGEDNDVKGDQNSITNLLDKVLGGDARFKIVPGQKLPAWAVRTPPAAGKKAEL